MTILHHAVTAYFGFLLKCEGRWRKQQGFWCSFLHVALNAENAIIHYCGSVNCNGRVIVESWDNCEE